MPKNKKKKRFFKRKLFVRILVAFCLFFAAVDAVLEVNGIPDFLKVYIQKKIKRLNIDFKCEDIKFGVVNGLIISKPEIQSSKNQTIPTSIAADRFRVEFSVFPFEMDEIELENGIIKTPLFPEYELEGKDDILEIRKIFGLVEYNNNKFKIRHFSGKIEKIIFNLSGTIKESELKTEKKDHPFQNYGRLFEQIQQHTEKISLNFRKVLSKTVDNLNSQNLKSGIIIKMQAYVDLDNLSKSNFSQEVSIPELKYGKLNLKTTNLKTKMSNGIIELRKFLIDIGDNGFISINGNVDIETLVLNGKINAEIKPETAKDFLSAEIKRFWKKNIKAKNTFIKIQGDIKELNLLEKFSRTSDYKASFNLALPDLLIKGINLSDISLTGKINNNIVKVEKFDLNFNKSIKSSGKLKISTAPFTLSGNLKIKGFPSEIYNFFRKKFKSVQKVYNTTKIKLNSKTELESDTDFLFLPEQNNFFYTSTNLSMNNFELRSSFYNYGAGKIIVSSKNLIIIPGVILEKTEGQLFANAVYDFRKKSDWERDCSKFTHFTEKRNFIKFQAQSTLCGNSVMKLLFNEPESVPVLFNGPTSLKAEGKIVPDDDDESIVQGQINDGNFQFLDLHIKNTKAEIDFRNDNVEIKNLNGKLSGGDLSAYLSYNLNTDTGNLSLNLKESDFSETLEGLGIGKIKGFQKGTADVAMKSLIYKMNDRVQIIGPGKINVRETDLWSIPFFTPLLNIIGKLWPFLDNFGRISTIDTDFRLKGTSIHLPNIITNGNVISLTSSGYYDWGSSKYSFFIEGNLLKNALPMHLMTLALKPISWFFQVELIGKGADARWKQLGGLRKLWFKKSKQ